MLREVKVFTIDATSSNSMKSGNPHSGIHETHVAKCLDTMCLDPSCNQGGHMICMALEGNGIRPSHKGKGFSEDGTMYTLNTIEQHVVCYEGQNCLTDSEKAFTIQAGRPDDHHIPGVCYGISRSCLKGGNGSNGGMPVGEDMMPSMVAQGTGAVCYAIENHPCDSRVTLTDDGIVQTLNARMGTGGGNVPMVLIGQENNEACWAVDSHPTDSRIKIAGDICPTVMAHVAKVGSDGPLVLIRKGE